MGKFLTWVPPLPPFWGGSQYLRLTVFRAGIIKPSEDQENLVTGDCHNSLIVPSLPNLTGLKSMVLVVKTQPLQLSEDCRAFQGNHLDGTGEGNGATFFALLPPRFV